LTKNGNKKKGGEKGYVYIDIILLIIISFIDQAHVC
jgi:hypothetical protein